MRIGIDLGGTKIETIVLDDKGAIRFRERRATPRGDYSGTVDALVDLVAAAEAAIGQTASVGIGMPGAISPATGLVKNANSTWLIGRTLDRDLEARLGRPVRLANDANCFALSEASDGAAAGDESLPLQPIANAMSADTSTRRTDNMASSCGLYCPTGPR